MRTYVNRTALLLLLLANAGPAAAQVRLAWKLEKGARYTVDTELTSKSEVKSTDALGRLSNQVEDEVHKARFEALVEDITVEKTFVVVMNFTSIERKLVSAAKNLTIEAKRGDDGKKKTHVAIKSENPLLAGRDASALMEKLASNLLDLQVICEISPSGQVMSAKLKGNPYNDLPADTALTKEAVKSLRKMLSLEDWPGTLAAEIFVALPTKPAAVDDRWPVRRSFGLMNVSLTAEGTGTLAAIDRVDGTTVATLMETMVYKADLTKFNTLVKELMEENFLAAGKVVPIEAEFKTKGNIAAETETSFDVDRGLARSTTWKELKIPYSGGVTITSGQEKQTTVFDIVLTLKSKSAWTRK